MTAEPPGPAAPASGFILIVDDDAGVVEVFAHCLRRHGYGVRLAATAEEVLRTLDSDVPRAILIDLHLPGADGLALLRQMRAKGLSTPVALITGDYFVDEVGAEEVARLGAALHFKPIWEDELLKVVERLVHPS